MAYSFHYIILLSSFLLISISTSKTSQEFNALVFPIMKHVGTLQYLTQISLGTPHLPINLVVDLGGQVLWLGHQSTQLSSSYRMLERRSIQCSATASFSPILGYNQNTCSLPTKNSLIGMSITGELAEDVINVKSMQGSISTFSNFLFSRASTLLLHGLASGAKGMAALGRNQIALPSQLAVAFTLNRKFTVCLPSSKSSKGFAVFGKNELSKSLMYTPLVTQATPEYFIGVKSVKINGERIPLNASLLLVDEEGVGGTKLSTIVPYTTLETSIYHMFTEDFVKASISFNMIRVASVAPFDVCFSSANWANTPEGPAVPIIDLVLQSDMVKWRIHGANSMVRVSEDVLCLGFMDGGLMPRTSIVIGGHQLENNLLEFDLAGSRMGFSSFLLHRHTDCSNFTFHPELRGSS